MQFSYIRRSNLLLRALSILVLAFVLPGVSYGQSEASLAQEEISRRNIQVQQILARGEFEDGLTEAKVVLAEAEKELDDEDPLFLTSLANLATAHSYLGNVSQAQEIYERLRDLNPKVFGENHNNTLVNLSNLADAYTSLGRLVEAKSIFLEVLQARRTAGGDLGSNLAAVLNNLGRCYIDLGSGPIDFRRAA